MGETEDIVIDRVIAKAWPGWELTTINQCGIYGEVLVVARVIAKEWHRWRLTRVDDSDTTSSENNVVMLDLRSGFVFNYMEYAAVVTTVCPRVLTGLRPTFNFVREGLPSYTTFIYIELERALKVEEPKRQPDGIYGHAVVAIFKPRSGDGGQSG